MKYLLFLLLPFAAQSQTITSTTTITSTITPLVMSSQDTTVVNGDTVYYTRNAIVINPVIVNSKGDTAYSLSWVAFDLNQAGGSCNTYVALSDRNNLQIATFTQPIPAEVVAVWGTSNAPIDDYILYMNKRFVRYAPNKTK